MATYQSAIGRKRTAILVVHGIGSQRALDTVRGVIRAVWLNRDNPDDKENRIWAHPQKDSADIDLTVMKTNKVPHSVDGRGVDFHELYWAHLMSETRAVAVLLWLYELARKGPIMKPGMNGLWWVAAIFLCLMNLSFAVLVVHGIFLFSRSVAQNMLVAPFLLLFGSIFFGLLVAAKWRAFRLIRLLVIPLLAGIALGVAYVFLGRAFPGGADYVDGIELITQIMLPTLIAAVATVLVMGKQGLRAFWRAVAISIVLFAIFIWADQFWNPTAPFVTTVVKAWMWGLNSPWSVAAASAVIGLYLIINATFLQPYLGDAARYFRNSPGNVAVRRKIRKEAADTLARLHDSGEYDRIVIVAHSLGTVVAYDMLRVYFSRITRELPPRDQLGGDFAAIDDATWQPDDSEVSIDDRKDLRGMARAAIANMVDVAAAGGYKNWLVTDFVTLGSALTHAYYLMCLDKKEARRDEEIEADVRKRLVKGSTADVESGLKRDFVRRVREREFPTCPPKRLDQDGLLTFKDPKTGERRIHNGALFGLTRWTNIYFPRCQIFWGDAIGGALSPIFGRHVVDHEVSTRKTGGPDFFTHNTYWKVDCDPDTHQAPHIQALRKAVDLADTGEAVELASQAANPSVHTGD